ncbi:synembryn-like [Topomyia yanbarensis]|uniref:synembryn-like n=1 Tax=Topomyia yanbarensis TaxID=2498891 RepID=UPI00273C9540|nr:synembryn-like [Topomyia yanbarensis]
MDTDTLNRLLDGGHPQLGAALAQFNKLNAQVFNFSHLTTTGQWVLLWNKFFEYLTVPTMPWLVQCLIGIKILSRDKTYLNETVHSEQLDCLLNLAGIGSDSNGTVGEDVQVEALKCLSNLIFQCRKCQELCLTNASTEGILRRIRTYKDGSICYDIQYFDMKVLFLLTAINCDIRAKVREDLHGLTYLVETLDLFMNQAADAKEFNDKDLELVNEVLKVLFNLTVRTPNNAIPEEEEANQFHRLAVIIHDLFFYRTLNRDKITSLQSNIVNLLTSVPVSCYNELITPLSPDDMENRTVVPFEGKNAYVLHVLVEFLRKHFQKAEKKSEQYELLSPILTVLVKAVRASGLNRRFVRSMILPPLVNVMERPEVGTELRNYICSLLTSPCTQIADLSAELLFVLCKENVGRMIKYTGYGNAAGLFANRGLLGGRQSNTEQYSSDSEDSDTEEYKQIQHSINPVLGCYEPPKPNPLEGMSEEQKEYEAMELVALMDQLQRQGIVQPCKIGEDGRPQPVEHILELQDEIPEQQRDHKRKT